MTRILLLETTSDVCSVALMDEHNVILENESKELKSHSKLLTLQIEQLLKETDTSYNNLDAVVVSKGPGSYTGLRIGVSTAKGICYASDIPLISVNTLHAMAHSYSINKNELPENSLLCPMLDARRMEAYLALYNLKLEEIESAQAKIINEQSFTDLFSSNTITFFGPGADKCKTVLTNNNANFIDGIYPKSSNMRKLASESFARKKFENLAYFEPFYLKDFVATTPKQKIL